MNESFMFVGKYHLLNGNTNDLKRKLQNFQ